MTTRPRQRLSSRDVDWLVLIGVLTALLIVAIVCVAT